MPRLTRIWSALRLGFRLRCCQCGRGHLLHGYLNTQSRCPVCTQSYGHYRADDAPAYFTIFIVGHIVIPGIVMTERLDSPPSLLFQMVFWLLVTLVLTLLLLPRVKGMVLALHWLTDTTQPCEDTPPQRDRQRQEKDG